MKKDKKDILNRLSYLEGHCRAIKQMIEDDKYCIDILNQSLAVQKALKQIDMLMMEDHLKTCAIHQIKEGQEDKTVQELIGIYKFK